MTQILTPPTAIGGPHSTTGTGAIVAAIAHIRSRDYGDGRATKTIWWCERENGWTPCRNCRHRTPEAARQCWHAYFKR